MSFDIAITAAAIWRGTSEQLPKPGFEVRDKRHDPVATAGLVALERALAGQMDLVTARTAVLGVTRVGCPHHVDRVASALLKRRPRQGYFARAGAHMIATYAAMALQTHGPAFTITGSAAVIPHIFTVASQLCSGVADQVILLAADKIGDELLSVAFVLSANGSKRLNPGILATSAQSDGLTLPALFELFRWADSAPVPA